MEPTSGEIPTYVDFKKYRNHINEVQKIRDVLFLQKKGPCQECTTQKFGVGIVTRIQISRYPDIQISRYPDIQISRCPDVQMSGYPDIRYQIPDIRYQVSEKKKLKSQKIGFPQKSKISSNE